MKYKRCVQLYTTEEVITGYDDDLVVNNFGWRERETKSEKGKRRCGGKYTNEEERKNSN